MVDGIAGTHRARGVVAPVEVRVVDQRLSAAPPPPSCPRSPCTRPGDRLAPGT
jgi:hypothetical protein